jgi:fatty acid desaturase
MTILLHFMAICGHLVHFSRFGMLEPRKMWQPCIVRASWTVSGHHTTKNKLLQKLFHFPPQSRVARWYTLKPKIPIWVNIRGPCNGRCCFILCPFGLLYGHLEYFVASLYILWPIGTFCGHLVFWWPFGVFYCKLVYIFPLLVCCIKENLATLPQSFFPNSIFCNYNDFFEANFSKSRFLHGHFQLHTQKRKNLDEKQRDPGGSMLYILSEKIAK